MKKILSLTSLLLCAVMMFSMIVLPVSAVCFENEYPNFADRYVDVSSDSWYYSAVSDVYMLMNGTVNENGQKVFLPEKSITREEFITVLYRLDKMAYLVKSTSRSDILEFCVDAKADTWYSDAVLWALSCGVSQGVSESLFGIGRNITREEAVTLLMRYYKKAEHLVFTAESSSEYRLMDEGVISDWAKESVEYAAELGLIHGTGTGNFEPQKNITRAETAQIFATFFYNLDYNFEYVFSADNVDELYFSKVTDGGKRYLYTVPAGEELTEALEHLSAIKPTGAKEDRTMEYNGPHYTVIHYREMDGVSVRNLMIMDESTLIVSGFKIYTFDEPCFKEYLELLLENEITTLRPSDQNPLA